MPRLLAALGILVTVALSGCGSSGGGSPQPNAGVTAGGAAGTSAAPPGSQAQSQPQATAGGTVTLTVAGKTSSFPSGTCNIIETSSVNLSLSSHDLNVMLPEKPGPFTAGNGSGVILPPPPGDEYQASFKVHGQWTQAGERAKGHVEGTAELLSSIGSGTDTEVPFTIDFECRLIPLGG